MTKAKHQGYSWWIRYVWNELVRSASESTPPSRCPAVEAPPTEILAAVAAARSTLTELMWTCPPASDRRYC